MSSIPLNSFTLNQTTILGRRVSTVTVVGARTRFKIDPDTRKRLENEIEGYSVDIIGALGHAQTVKLNIDAQDTVKSIVDALREGKVVTANFGEPSTLRGKCYAMLNANGQLISGVSCTASEINIVKLENPDFDDFMYDDIIE